MNTKTCFRLFVILCFCHVSGAQVLHQSSGLLLDSARYYIERDVAKSRLLIDSAKRIAEDNGDLYLLGNALVLSGRVYHFDGKNEKARSELYEAVKVAQSLNDLNTLANAYDNLGMIYRTSGYFEKADDFFDQSISIYIQNRDTVKWANAINNKACSLRDQLKIKEALVYNDSALKLLDHFEEDYIYYESFFIRSSIFNRVARYDSAYHFLKEFFRLERSLENADPSVNYATMATYCLKLNKAEEAEQYLDTAIQLFHGKRKLHTIHSFHDNFASYYLERENFEKALEHRNKAYRLLNNIFKQDYEGAVSKAEASFNLYKEQQEVRSLKTANELSRLRSRELTVALLGSGVSTLLLVVLFFNKQRELRKENYRKRRLVQMNNDFKMLIEKKDEFLASVSHNLKTPLVAIQYILKSLYGSPDVSSSRDCSEKVGTIRSAVNKMLNSTQEMLEGYNDRRLLAQLKSRIRVNELISNLIEIHKEHARSKGIFIDYQSRLPDSDLEINEFSLQQVLDNLLSNAIKYAPENTAVSIHVRLRFSAFLYVEIVNPIDKTGFRKYLMLRSESRNEPNSSGLGLFLVRRYVEVLKGRIWYNYNETGYARFSFVVPVIRPR